MGYNNSRLLLFVVRLRKDYNKALEKWQQMAAKVFYPIDEVFSCKVL